MRIQYLIITFILLVILFAIAIGMLSGVVPSFENLLNFIQTG